MLCWYIGPQAVSYFILFYFIFILGVGDVHIAVDSASPAHHAHVTD